MKVSTLTVAVASLVLFGCATAPTKPPPVNVTGQWTGDVAGAWGSAPVRMTLHQVEEKVTGEVVFAGAQLIGASSNGPVTGTVSGDILWVDYPTSGAEIRVRGNEMTGMTKGGNRLVLKRAQ